MYVTVQFIILEILLGLIFLVVLYFMVRELLKKIIRREIREIKEPLQVLANYLVEQSHEEDPQDPDGPDGPESPGGPQSQGPGGSGGKAPQPGERGNLPGPSPEKLPEEPVDVADEFVQLKNTNRVSAYNIRVQKIWDLYKQNKITLAQYKDELLRLKKEFGIATGEDENILAEKKPLSESASGSVRLQPLTPTPSAAPSEKVKNIDTEPQPAGPDQDADTDSDTAAKQPDFDRKDRNNNTDSDRDGHKGRSKNKDIDKDIGKDLGNKAASL